MASRLETDIKVFCEHCGESIGYVVVDGHKDWLCETCGGGRCVALPTDEIPKEGSSVKIEPWEHGDMLVIRHFTGSLLMGQFEARHLLALLKDALSDTTEMPVGLAHKLVADREELVAQYMS